MSFNLSYTRPLATVTGTETASYTTTLTEDGSGKKYTIDVVATVNATSKLVRKIIITPVFNGTSLTFGVDEYVYAGGAANYVSATNPATSAAVGGGPIAHYDLTQQDMDAFHTAAGDVRS
jgi:hypothetical protein